MKNISFYIILISHYLFAAMMFDVISHDGLLHGAIVIAVLLIIIAMILLVVRKLSTPDKKYWELFRNAEPSIMGVLLIMLFILRLYVLSQI